MNVVELFSGIGAQAKALERCGIDHNIIATCDWDINAVIAYDIMHNGPQGENQYLQMTNEQLNDLIVPLNISADGKNGMTDRAKQRLPRITKCKLLYAIERTNNLLDITSIRGDELPDFIDLITYSFPCQDLSLAGNWHNNEGGINRDSGNRSSLLWEVERILFERNEMGMRLPKFLLMENVTAILSSKHIHNFEEWKVNLSELGYANCVLTLDARHFGVPQMRNRTYMLSCLVEQLDDDTKVYINELFNRLENDYDYLLLHYPRNGFGLNEVIKNDYNIKEYLDEAKDSNPNRTVSREEIGRDNIHIDNNTQFVPTITTKQDRNPNSGLINFELHEEEKMNFRYLTPRECFLIMGFDEEDYQILKDNDFITGKNRHFFTRDKMNKMAGNSICVNVLESLFELIDDINFVIDQ